MNIIEYPIPHEQGQEGFGFIYDKSTDTIHLTGGAFHWELMREAPVDITNEILYAGYVDQVSPEFPGIDVTRASMNGLDVLSEDDEQRVEEALHSYLYKDPDYLNKTSAANTKQIFNAEEETEWIKALYFAEEDVLYWWYVSDADGVPTHIDALGSWGLEWDDLQKMTIIPVLGGEINGDNPPFVVDWRGVKAQQQRATELLNELLETLRNDLNSSYWTSKVSSKIVEVKTKPGFGGYGGTLRRPVVFIPEQDTMYVGNMDSSHASVVAAIDEQFLTEYPKGYGYSGDDRWEHYGYWEFHHDDGSVNALTGPTPTEKHEAELVAALAPVNPKFTNIYDSIEKELDHHVFKNGEPRQSVVNFIKRLYGRALKHEYGIQNAELFVDLYITGSLTTFQYSETSDCDVSVFPNYERFAKSFGEDSSKTRKRLVALSIEHIDGTFLPGTAHPLQFFVVADGIERSDLYHSGLRSAWSIYDEMWVVPPEKERSVEVAAEYPDAYSRASSMAVKMTDALDRDPESARDLWKQVHMKRQLDQRAGLGDYSEGNIVYKWLLHEGLFDRIKSELHEYIAKVAISNADIQIVDIPYDGMGWHGSGLPWVYDAKSNIIYVGSFPAFHIDLFKAMQNEYISDTYLKERLQAFLVGRVGIWDGQAESFANQYSDRDLEYEEYDINAQLENWILDNPTYLDRPEDVKPVMLEMNPPTRTSVAEGMSDEDEIRWGYNGKTGEVKSCKAWGENIETHMDMASDWLGGISYEEMEREYEHLFFGYAYWDRENQTVFDIEPYSLDMQSEGSRLGPGDYKLIEDQINSTAPFYMEEG